MLPQLDCTLFVDCETTGLSHRSHRIAELAVATGWSDAADSWRMTFDEKRADPRALEIFGYNRSLWHNKGITQYAGLERLRTFVNDHAQGRRVHWVAYNAPFDQGFLCALSERCNMRIAGLDRFYCALRLARQLLPNCQNYKLTTVCEALEVPVWKSHSADADVVLLKKVWLKLLAIAAERSLANAV